MVLPPPAPPTGASCGQPAPVPVGPHRVNTQVAAAVSLSRGGPHEVVVGRPWRALVPRRRGPKAVAVGAGPARQPLELRAVRGRLVPVPPGPLPVYQVLRTVPAISVRVDIAVVLAQLRSRIARPSRRLPHLCRTVPHVGFAK